ncbi:Metallo-dependent phosphatase-like protein [Microdochium trichocladiopsis]|uniref:Double-strand break repair protein n=1 Tax=Microdochium trichocladiopsis TaxID=1682393 RepID=A0A9P8YJP6_9PEZI|nr:Metallo-dependent phosphatase-like protein [Microdochium trichocladiopsis]KAH7040666.1 Metallo-dependent phosphatase-like protein [Microdochium trichocladiopsis]
MSASQFTEADTIRILIATDNHVGYEERDPIRTDDSWRTFDEIMNIARTEDVDMVLLAGDLFHDNKPSRKSMYQVMRSLRKNCLGMKPCELQFMSDASDVFDSAFSHVNYEDPDINISIPVFSIHGNHDDPSGEGNYCSLDLLQVAGLVNYFGRVPEADNIEVKPVLLQKGGTKLALFGLSNVRDERMFRTFRDHRVKWFRPNVQSSDWFNLLAVHQNHHAHTATGYLPENMLPEWMDLVVWGHEHECLIDPVHNPETGFHVMQPGSSVATSLVPGEAVAKHVAIMSIVGKDFTIEKHRLKSVRPFVTREIILHSDKRFKGLEKRKDNRGELTRKLMEVVEEMIEEANTEWNSIQEEEIDPRERPLPLVRLKVEYTAPDGGQFDIENPQRFSNRFSNKVANTNDVVYFYRKKKVAKNEKAADVAEEILANLDPDEIQVSSLVEEFLAAQSLKILPQAPFGDAVTQFVTKDDKHAMEHFVSESLSGQVRQMLSLEDDEEDLENAMTLFKQKLEQQFKLGGIKQSKMRRYKPQPDGWDSDLDGHWQDQPEAIDTGGPAPTVSTKAATTASRTTTRGRKTTQVVDDDDEDMDDAESVAPAPKTRTRAPAAKKAAPKPKAPAKKPAAKGRGKKAQVFEQSDDEDEDDVFMDDDDHDPPVPAPKRTTATRTTTTRSQPTRAAATATATKTRQSKLNFSSQKATQQEPMEISDDAISDDPFESMPSTRSRGR